VNDIRHIVLDVGKVLVHYDPHQGYFALIPDPAERTAFLTDVCSNAWNAEQDRGRRWEEAEVEAIARHPDKADLIRAFRKNWHLMVSHEYPESVALFRALLADSRDVTLLTNFASDTFREAQRRFPILKEGRGVTVSGDIGLIKPDPAIFKHHAKTFDLSPESTLFFDDSPANVDAARGTGWNAELFTSAAKMREDLERYGVEV
jgi:2-haloacid dehalogenase